MESLNTSVSESDNSFEGADDGKDEMNYIPKRLVEGIDLKELCTGKEITFQIKKDFEKDVMEQYEEEEHLMENIFYYDSKSQRENRGAPPLNSSFESLAKEMFNITEDGCVKKQIITHGIGKIVPDYAYVTVHYNLYKEHCELPFDSTYLRNRPERFRLDRGETILGLDYALKSMKKNENSRFFIKWEYAFGEMGCPNRIEKKCNIIADVTLLNFVEICEEPGALTENEIDKVAFTKSLTQAKQHHFNGREDFVKGDHQSACISYRKALKILNSLRLANEEEEKAMLQQKVKCLVNLAICYNKLGKHEQACVCCQEILAIDPKNVKGYFHYGKANLALSNFQVAQRLLLKANALKPNDKDIHQELIKLENKKALYKAKDQIFWKKAFESTENSEEKKKVPEIPVEFESFEKSLRASLQECVSEDKPFVMSGTLRPEEKKICNSIAKDMNLEYESKDGVNIFKQKKECA